MSSVGEGMRILTSIRWGPVIRGAITALALLLLLQNVDLNQAWVLAGNLQVSHFAMAVLAGVAANLFGGIAWAQLLQQVGIKLPFSYIVRYYMTGLFFAFFTPGGLGGDAVRVYQLQQETSQGMAGFSSILASRVLSIATLLLAGALISGIVLPYERVTHLTLGLALGIWGFLVMFMLHPKYWGHKLSQLLNMIAWRRLHALADELVVSLGLVQWKSLTLLQLLALYIAHHGMVVLAVYWSFLALGIDVGFLPVLALVPLSRVLVLLPFSISGLGVQEAAFVYLFGLVGVTSHAAFSASLLSHVVLMVLPLSGGIVFLFGRRQGLPDQLKKHSPPIESD